MFQILSHDALLTHGTLRSKMHLARSRQFSDRHKWNVTKTPEGLEIDQFDTFGTTYLVVAQGTDHVASLRLRHASAGNMVQQAFPDFWGRHGHTLQDKPEVTRLCSAPHVSGLQRQLGVARLLLGLCRHCRASDQPTIFGIVFPAVARNLSRAGWAPAIIDQQGVGRASLLLSSWTATASVDWTLQEAVASLEDKLEDQTIPVMEVRAVA